MRESSVSPSQRESKESEKRKLPPITLSSFADPRQPWILVPDGSLKGHFDWVPKKLRVGPWSKLATPTLIVLTCAILYSRPTRTEDSSDTLVSSYPSAFSTFWWYNILTCVFMLGTLLWSMSLSSPAIAITFTILSWIMNILRHGINACAPFLCDNHFLLKVNHIMRFPALVTATITFVVWNAVLLPYIYFIAMKTREKKLGFVRWNFNFRLTQLHVCNIIYAVMNTLVTGSKQEGQHYSLFDTEDAWNGFAYSLVYGIFYTLILDRVGVHLYPVFSPRSSLVMITWLMAFSLHYISFKFWNHVMTNHLELFRFDFMMAINGAIMGLGAFLHWVLSKENDRMSKSK